jgi:Skp family chaperone for outer membrane proteins
MNKSYWTGFLTGTTVLAVGALTLLVSSGFQGASIKFGNVDANKVVQGIEAAKGYGEAQKNALAERQNILTFLDTNRLMKKEDIEKFKTLSLKVGKTDAEKAELEKVKTAAIDAKKKFEELQFKTNPTDAELKLLSELQNRQAATPEIAQKMVQEFQREMQQLQEENMRTIQDSYRSAIQEVGKKQGFTILFDANVAPFAVNDATDDVVKAAAKK